MYRNVNAVEPVLKDHPIGHKNVVSQDRWPLVTGSITLKCGTFCQEYLVFKDRWSFMVLVSQDRFYCNVIFVYKTYKTKIYIYSIFVLMHHVYVTKANI